MNWNKERTKLIRNTRTETKREKQLLRNTRTETNKKKVIKKHKNWNKESKKKVIKKHKNWNKESKKKVIKKHKNWNKESKKKVIKKHKNWNKESKKKVIKKHKNWNQKKPMWQRGCWREITPPNPKSVHKNWPWYGAAEGTCASQGHGQGQGKTWPLDAVNTGLDPHAPGTTVRCD